MADDLVQRLREFGAKPYDFTACQQRDDTFTEAANALARKDAEIARLTKYLSIANSQAEEFERKFYLESDRAERAEARVREAPVATIAYDNEGCTVLYPPLEWQGKQCVALVLLDTEEAK